MPRDGDTPLARFADAVVRERGFSFGSPHLSEEGSEVVLPVLRTGAGARRYALAPDASGALSAVDIGRIDRLRIRNDSVDRIFLPPGTLFESRETASRALAVGIVIEPGALVEAEVRCVHATAPIRSGAALRQKTKLPPYSLTQAVLGGDQGLTWSVAAALSEGDIARVSSDWTAVSFGGDVCGAVFLDGEGVAALEIWDSPGSMVAVPRTLAPSSRNATQLALNPRGAMDLAKQFLSQLARCVFRPARPESYITHEGLAEYTMIGAEVVHLIAFGRDLARQELLDHAAPSASGVATGSVGLNTLGATGESHGSEDGEVMSAAVATAETSDADEDAEPVPRPRRRKVLTSGWDSTTLGALERYSAKEFGGDRSAALRSLTRSVLTRRGYLGPLPMRATAPPSARHATLPPAGEESWEAEETRIHDLERIAQTASYASWLRKRARLELERLAGASSDPRAGDVARAVLERLVPSLPQEPALEPEEPPVLEQSVAPPAAPPVDVTPLLRRAVMASANGEYADALSAFDEVLEAEPVNLTALLGRAVTLRRAGKAQEALAGLDLVLRLDPDNAAAHLNRGRVLQERGDLRGALDAFDRLADVAPNDWDVWMERGDVLMRMGRTDDALRSFSEALKRNPDDEKLLRRVRALEGAREAGPVPVKIDLPAGLEEGQSYVVEGANTERAYGPFRALVAQRLPALLVTRHPPDQVRKDPALAHAQIAHLYHGTGPEAYSPAALPSLSRLVERFVEEHHGRGVILMDGLELLVASTSFRDALLFVEHVNELVLQGRVVFLLALAPSGLSGRERALLERSLRVLT